ncbi:DUF6928 family protein [Dietzia sp.]|uniref:DUF6928 family protein n=1 Tax=Dietzia sp. TaxID=1871616 RepID=UPI002FDA7175
MGLNTMAIVADSVLGDEQLGVLGIAPTGRAMGAEDALLVSEPEQACVVRTGTYTAIAGSLEPLMEVVESDHLDLPGTVIAATSVSSVGFTDFCVFEDGRLRRHLCVEEDKITMNDGEPLPEEGRFVFTSQDEELEVDGDILIDQVLVIAGVDAEASLFYANGDAFAPNTVAGDESATGGQTATRVDDSDSMEASGKKGFFRRFRRS